MSALLDVRNLKTYFKTDYGLVKAVDGVSYHVNEHEIVGMVGESGCGKSVSQMSLLRLIPSPPGEIAGGEVIFEGQDLLKFKPNGPEMRSIRGGKIAMIFQEPMTSLNPVLTIGRQLTEMVELHLNTNRQAARKRAIELMKMVGIPDPESRIDDYPHQFSGGMRQRVMIAMALSCNPRMVIADEPTTAVDVTTQAQLLELMRDLVEQFGASLVVVTHNLGVIARYAERIYVMYAGRIVEAGACKDIFANPSHPYTIGLLKCVTKLDERQKRKLLPIVGMPPALIGMPPTCAFLPRCPFRVERCQQEPWPELRVVDGEHFVSCYVDTRHRKAALTLHTRLEAARPPVLSSRSEPLHIQATDDTLAEVNNLKMYFPVTRGVMKQTVAEVKAVDGISFKIMRGETLGLVGESGCGKTTTGRCFLRLYQPTGGQIVFEGKDISQLPESKIRPFRRRMSLIFQDPFGSLDPRQSAASIIGEPLTVHRMVRDKHEYDERVEQLFRMVQLDPSMGDRVAHEFSGGQRQRIGVARALACEPSLVVCDEPVSALDVSIQAQIIELLEELQERLPGLTYLFISHDLSVVRHLSDRVAVMYLGRIVELTTSAELYDNPLHPYTRALLSAVPIADPFVEEKRERVVLKGEVPSPLHPPSGCHFHPRCPQVIRECKQDVPPLRDVGGGRLAACIRL
ncbi:MAG: ABC transporter ATP-binding protein [Chloroflexi bacterium]|nr:ABC transporter ATP-binding protein [Chloroflexota bacterium]